MDRKWKLGLALLLVLGVAVVTGAWWIVGPGESARAGTPQAAASTGGGAEAGAYEMTVYMSPTCGCCGLWVEHMEEHGFEIRVEEMQDVRSVKIEHGVPPSLGSCHTGIVNGYVVEGHVPAAEVIRLLEEAPDVRGLAVPGMPMGSPGMEGAFEDDYEVLTFDDRGRTTVFATYP